MPIGAWNGILPAESFLQKPKKSESYTHLKTIQSHLNSIAPPRETVEQKIGNSAFYAYCTTFNFCEWNLLVDVFQFINHCMFSFGRGKYFFKLASVHGGAACAGWAADVFNEKEEKRHSWCKFSFIALFTILPAELKWKHVLVTGSSAKLFTILCATCFSCTNYSWTKTNLWGRWRILSYNKWKYFK